MICVVKLVKISRILVKITGSVLVLDSDAGSGGGGGGGDEDDGVAGGEVCDVVQEIDKVDGMVEVEWMLVVEADRRDDGHGGGALEGR